MQYEEYKERMEKQGREFVEAHDYRLLVEPVYMALPHVSKDMFCQLPDEVILDLSALHSKLVDERHVVDEQLAKVDGLMNELKHTRDALEEKLAEKDQEIQGLTDSIKKLVAKEGARTAECVSAYAALDALIRMLPASTVREFVMSATRRNLSAFADAAKQA